VPRAWVASGKEIRIDRAATRWGAVNFKMQRDAGANRLRATVELARPGAPGELQVKFRLPAEHTLESVTVNGKAVTVGGTQHDTAIFPTGRNRQFEVVAEFS
jgi:hypothetical protein